MKKFYHHFIFWVLCLALEVYIEFSWIKVNYTEISIWKRFLMVVAGELLLFTVKIPLVYSAFYIIGNYAIKEQKNVKALLSLLLVFTVSALVSHFLIINVIFPYIYADFLARSFFTGRIINAFIDLVFVSGIAIAIEQYRHQNILRDKEKNLMKEKLTAELSFLKAQINPHFLFNTLNSLYALARKKSDQTPEVILKLSALFRFMLYESTKSNIPISQEIAIIETYIELEKIRYNERLVIKFIKQVDDESFHITPLILLPFIENAFKHGASETRFDSFIHIDLLLKNGLLLFTVKNSKEEDDNKTITENIGLRNVRRQLELVYSDYKLDIKNEKNIFSVNLLITLNSHEKL